MPHLTVTAPSAWRARRAPALGRAANRVLWQLCAAARQCQRGHGSLQQLQWLLDQAGAIAEAADRAFPEWIPGAVWARDAYALDAVQSAWQRYRRVRSLRSHDLDRMLLETLVCADLRRAGLLDRLVSSGSTTGYGRFISAKGLALSAVTAVALICGLNGIGADTGAGASPRRC